jgi:hypothetical protein
MSFEEVTVPETIPSKKRKAKEDDDEVETLRSEAKNLCPDGETWSKVSKYKKAKLQSWISDQKFALDRRTADEVTRKLVHLGGSLLDRIFKGQGFVQEALCEDRELQLALQIEAYPLLKILNNKMRVLFLAASDVARGLGRRPQSHAFVEEEKKEDVQPIFPSQTAAETLVRTEIQSTQNEIPSSTESTVLDLNHSREERVREDEQADSDAVE